MIQSSTCSQKISHMCNAHPLTDLASWIGRDGEMHKYWHGNGEQTEGCRCFAYKNCTQLRRHENSCNCDSFGNNVTDDGIITTIHHLPITQLNYGSVNSLGDINYLLGPLICKGKKKPYRSEYEASQKKKMIMNISNLNDTLRHSVKTISESIKKSSFTHESSIKIIHNQIDQETLRYCF